MKNTALKHRVNMKKILLVLVLTVGLASLSACGIGSFPGGGKTSHGKDSTSSGDKETVLDGDDEDMPADLTQEDIIIVEELNSESNLPYDLYLDMGDMEEPYEIPVGEKSSVIAVKIPRTDGTLRTKEIEINDKEFDVYGMSVGCSVSDFENKMEEKGYDIYHQLSSMRYEAFSKGNIYIAINYNESDKVETIFMNLLLDYNEWRGIE